MFLCYFFYVRGFLLQMNAHFTPTFTTMMFQENRFAASLAENDLTTMCIAFHSSVRFRYMVWCVHDG
uniref:Putative secreted protein n=1 Tax=Anopheles triannulatus TaxID=58253 RepID=A0A2M4B3I3_9DIPT